MKGAEYRIKKIEKGPLARFKNQNLLIKKFGETGLQIYKAITGKRTTAELQKDLGIEAQVFDQVVNFMQEAGMVELEPTSGKAPSEEERPARALEEIPPEEEIAPSEEVPPLEEQPQPEKKTPKKKRPAYEEIKPIEFGEEEAPAEEVEREETTEEEAAAAEEEKAPEEEGAKEEEKEPEEEIQPITIEEYEEEKTGEEGEEKEEAPAEEEKPAEEEIGITFEEEAAPKPEEPELSPVEKIISDKYGDIGLQVYALIDGQRTAEEIMRETGLSEQKLVEILDFMDEQGIIKLDYPKGGGAPAAPGFAAPAAAQVAEGKEEGFTPMIEGEESLDEARAVTSPVELPIKAPLDIVKSVQLKAKLMLKFSGNRGGRVMDAIDGKNDILDISLRLDMPLYEVADILRFMMENGMVIMKPLARTDVRRKYGDDGYSVYKKFGKEGLMLYELIGKELTIRQMADKITKEREKIIDMFIFIHKVLGIELPIDRDVLSKQLGI